MRKPHFHLEILKGEYGSRTQRVDEVLACVQPQRDVPLRCAQTVPNKKTRAGSVRVVGRSGRRGTAICPIIEYHLRFVTSRLVFGESRFDTANLSILCSVSLGRREGKMVDLTDILVIVYFNTIFGDYYQ